MKYQTLLESGSPKLEALEEKLGVANQKPARPVRRVTRLCADGKKRGGVKLAPHHTLIDWFWKMIVKNESNGCWEWRGTSHHTGYGIFKRKNVNYSPHRFAAELVADVPYGMFVCHTCDNKLCCNPAHLFMGTAKDNRMDCKQKGRLVAPKHERNGQAKITKTVVSEIRRVAKSGKHSSREIGEMFGISQSHTSSIIRGVYWSDGPCYKTKAARAAAMAY